MSNHSTPALHLSLTLATLLAAAPALADSACMDDARRFCPDVPFGEGRVMSCLQARWNELSGGCIEDLQAVQAKSREITLSCAADVWSYCQGVVPGDGRVKACLGARWEVLSSTCKDELNRIAKKTQAIWDSCETDAMRLCAGLRIGGGQVYLCLKAQESQVSGPCQRALR